MKIALVCVHYPPLRSSCAIQMRDLAQQLLQQGHEPIVVVPTDNLSKAWVSELLDGVQVFRLAAFKIIDVGFFRRAINEMLLSFTMLYGLRKSNFPITKLDAVVWYSPTIFFGPLVSALKRSSKCPSYLILRDIFPEWALDLGILRKGPVYYLFKLVARYQYSVADTIGVQTSANLKYLEYWNKKSNRKLEVLNNWLADAPKQGTSISIDNTTLKGRKIFVYVGNMGIAQGMDVLVDLAECLSCRHDIGFLFVGRGTEVERLQESVVTRRLHNVIFFDEIDSREVPSLLDQCHIGLVALHPKHQSHNIPGKFLTYLQAGIPVLARINPGTDLVKIINEEGVGKVYVGDNIDEFKNVAEHLVRNDSELQHMSINCLSLYKRSFTSNNAATQVVSSLTCILE